MDTDNTDLTSNGTCIQRHTVNTKYRKSRLFFKIMKYPRNNNCTQLIQFYGLITEDLYVGFFLRYFYTNIFRSVSQDPVNSESTFGMTPSNVTFY